MKSGKGFSMRHRLLAVSVIAGAVVLTTACASTRIGQVLADPAKYANRDIALHGEVTRSVGLLGHGAFELDDGTGRIWVVARRGVPRQGARVKAEGRVKDVVDAGGILPLPKEIGSGVVLIEPDRNRD
jgi:hypothetical protein